jgi:homogentisate 1,2-dioxygenase
MSGHGPDAASYEKAVNAKLAPSYLDGTLAFMFETRYVYEPTAHATESKALDRNYDAVWDGFGKARPSPRPSPRGEGE